MYFGFTSFNISDIKNYIQIRSIITISVSVSQLTVGQVHKEFNLLADKIAAKYEQLDSGEFGGMLVPLLLMLSMPN